MSMSRDKYDQTFPPVENGNAIRQVMAYNSGAGTPTVTSTVPTHIGQMYLDTSAANMWIATALSSPPVVGDFKIMT
jgi:hypothetical protein